MLIIGLTGGIGSGKSTVAGMLRELGAEIIDADMLAREVVEPGKPAWAEIVAAFGQEVLRPDGTINRSVLGAKVFSEPTALAKLGAITHPWIGRRTKELLKVYRSQGSRVVVIEAPLLLEGGMDAIVDEVWVVAVPEAMQIERVTRRDKLSAEEVHRRIASQMPLAEKLQRAHRVVDASVSLDQTRAQVWDYWRDMMEKDSAHSR